MATQPDLQDYSNHTDDSDGDAQQTLPPSDPAIRRRVLRRLRTVLARSTATSRCGIRCLRTGDVHDHRAQRDLEPRLGSRRREIGSVHREPCDLWDRTGGHGDDAARLSCTAFDLSSLELRSFRLGGLGCGAEGFKLREFYGRSWLVVSIATSPSRVQIWLTICWCSILG